LTSVAVTEGLVQVDSRGQQLFIGPGQQWSSQTEPLELEPTATPEGPANAVSTARAMTSARARGARVGERPLGVPGRTDDAERLAPTGNSGRSKPSVSANANTNTRQSTLGEENQLYAQALARAGAGDLAQSLTGLAALIRDYPRSPLAQSAQADRFRLLEQAGNKSAAAQEARRYLSAYPNGFARVEARRIALIGLEAPQ
jgi:TolA-binding protein